MASFGLGIGRGSVLIAAWLVGVAACGARSELGVSERASGGASSTTSTTSTTTGTGGSGGSGCVEGTTRVCGSNVGACQFGQETCHEGVFGPCTGGVEPKPEACTGVDDNCNGTVNDCDPGSGTCTPKLLVTGSTPSSPNCIDFPVMKGSAGTFTYTCPGTGGTVTAVLGGTSFMGTVSNNYVKLDAFTTIGPPQTPDGCTWQDHHHIEGAIHSLMLTYTYSEMVVVKPPGINCWNPCTETGTVEVSFP
jgi:hypothetical protein